MQAWGGFVFKRYRLNDRGLEAHERIYNAYNYLWNIIDDKIPEGKERKMMVIKLEESLFYATRSLCQNKEFLKDEK